MIPSSHLAAAGVISKLSIRQWTGRASDKPAGRETAKRNRAQETMVRVHKTLVPQEALEPIQHLASQVRTYHYDNTVAWSPGAHFLPAKLSMAYSAAIQEFRLTFDGLAREFYVQYPSLVQRAPNLLGDLFRPKDYPSLAKMKALFGIDVSYEPVPEGGHFFANLASSTLEEFRRDLEAKNSEREKLMRKDLWKRLHDPVLKMADSLSKTDRTFHDTLVTNIRDIATRMDDLNVFDDPELRHMAAALRRTLSRLDPNVLRSSEGDRAQAAAEAQRMAAKISDAMAGYMSLQLAA
jgi:hypothetical protein